MNIQIEESGMLFGDFAPENVFQIEKSASVSALGEGIAKVEFVLRKDSAAKQTIVFVEAKSSLPKDSTEFFDAIKKKMLYSLIIWFTAVAGRHANIKGELGVPLGVMSALKKQLVFVLVIPNMPTPYCIQASDKFRQAMNIERKLWNFRDVDVLVLNSEKAAEYGLVSKKAHTTTLPND